jgi:hypothetical protein
LTRGRARTDSRRSRHDWRRPAVVLPERGEDAAALALAVGCIALQLLQLGQRPVEIGAHLLQLRIDRAALLRLAAEQREEATALAAEPPRLRGDAVDVELLPARLVLQALDLSGAGRIGIAAIDRDELRLKPQADRVAAARVARRAARRATARRAAGIRRGIRRLGCRRLAQEREHVRADGQQRPSDCCSNGGCSDHPCGDPRLRSLVHAAEPETRSHYLHKRIKRWMVTKVWTGSVCAPELTLMMHMCFIQS